MQLKYIHWALLKLWISQKLKYHIERDLSLKRIYLQCVFVHVLNGSKKATKANWRSVIVLSFYVSCYTTVVLIEEWMRWESLKIRKLIRETLWCTETAIYANHLCFSFKITSQLRSSCCPHRFKFKLDWLVLDPVDFLAKY